MAMEFWNREDLELRFGRPDWIPDDGGDVPRNYPLITDEMKNDDTRNFALLFDPDIQDSTTNQALLVAVFHQWFMSFFRHGYFKWEAIKSQVPWNTFKSWMMTIYKKDMPLIVLDPQVPEIDEQSLLASNEYTRYNILDPITDGYSAATIYSVPVMGDDLFRLAFRRNTIQMDINVMIMERTMARRDNTFNFLVSKIRHRSKFTIFRNCPILIPRKYIIGIAMLHGMDWKSDEFLSYLNTISDFPIRRELRMTGKYQFFMPMENIPIRFDVPTFPARDTPEMTDAISLGSRITEQFVLTAELPIEFLFMVGREYVGKVDLGEDDDPEAITFISPIFNDPDYPKEINGWQMSNKVDLEMQEGDGNTIDIYQCIRSSNPYLTKEIHEYVSRGGHIKDLVMTKLHRNGELAETGSILHDDGTFEIPSPEVNHLYTLCIYLNTHDINLIRAGRGREWAGNIEIDPRPQKQT